MIEVGAVQWVFKGLKFLSYFILKLFQVVLLIPHLVKLKGQITISL